MLKGNHCEALKINQKNDNTIIKGYISSEQLHKELQRSGQATVSYIEKLKETMSDEDLKALNEQIASEEFREQLHKAVDTAKEKINQIYEKTQLSQRLGKEKQNIINMINSYQKQLEYEQHNKLKIENEELKEQLKNSKKNT